MWKRKVHICNMLAIGFPDTIEIWIEQVSSFLQVLENELNGY